MLSGLVVTHELLRLRWAENVRRGRVTNLQRAIATEHYSENARPAEGRIQRPAFVRNVLTDVCRTGAKASRDKCSPKHHN